MEVTKRCLSKMDKDSKLLWGSDKILGLLSTIRLHILYIIYSI